MVRKVLHTVLAMVFGLFIGICLLEVGVRVFIAVRIAPKKWNDRPVFYFAQENGRALQDYRYPDPKDPATYRIAVVGDSFSFAPYMQFTDAFPKTLERMLNLNANARKAEVINYGVPAYSSTHEVESVERALEEGSDLVVLQITLNDPELKPIRPTGINQALPDRFGPFEPQGWARTLFTYWKTGSFVAERIHNTRTHQAYRDYFFGLFSNPRGYRIYSESVARMAELCRSANIPFVAVVFPLFGVPLDDSYPFQDLHKKAADPLSSRGVPVLDLFAIYGGIPVDRLLVYPGVDRHPNEIAHRMAAERIYLWLEELKILPEDLRIKLRYTQRMGTVNQPAWKP